MRACIDGGLGIGRQFHTSENEVSFLAMVPGTVIWSARAVAPGAFTSAFPPKTPARTPRACIRRTLAPVFS
jgi:hypothetical protein